ncbi:GDP-mannose 4,6-dehydratase [bacterium]|nr:GDP-mannose 4,6-dehydratase [bacterium]
MKKIFITGIEGFVGQYLVDELQRNGYEIGGLYFHSASIDHLKPFDLKLYAGDIVDRENFWHSLDDFQPDAVVHLAGITFIPQANSEPINTWRINLMGTLNLLEWSRQRKADTKLLIVSSGEIYGAPKSIQDLPFTENSCLSPQNIYASTKAVLDFAAQQYIRIWKMPIIIARPFNHIGPGQSANFVTSAFARQIARIAQRKQEPIVRVGNLSAARDFTDVRDVVRAYRLLLEKIDSGIFNICSGKAIKIQAILDKFIELSGIDVKIEIDPEKLRPVDVPKIYGSYDKLSKSTGWIPQIATQQSLADILTPLRTPSGVFFAQLFSESR